MDNMYSSLNEELFEKMLTWIWEHSNEDYTEYARALHSIGFSDDAIHYELSVVCGLWNTEITEIMKEVKNEG